MSNERTLDDAMQDFLDEYGSQFIRLSGPDIEGDWCAEIVIADLDDIVGVSKTPAAAIDDAMEMAREQDPARVRQTPDTGERSE